MVEVYTEVMVEVHTEVMVEVHTVVVVEVLHSSDGYTHKLTRYTQ